jgi:hypothetical protein
MYPIIYGFEIKVGHEASFEENIFWPIFVVKIPPLVKKKKKIFFVNLVKSRTQLIDLVELCENMWFCGTYDEYLGD